MGKRLYGSINNRFEEGHNFNDDKLLHVGDDITMYYYSDRQCYYITDVIDQKHIKVKRYYVCADHDKEGGMGHQNWMFFKSRHDQDVYLNKFFPDHKITEDEDQEAEDWVFKYNKWKRMVTYTAEDLDTTDMFGRKLRDAFFSKKEIDKLEAGKNVNKYYDLSGGVSFGVRNYYYDWEY